MAYCLIDEPNGIICRLSETISFAELLAANVDCSHHFRHLEHHYQIWDFTDIISVDMDGLDAVSIARTGSKILFDGPVKQVALINKSPDFGDLINIYLETVDGAAFQARVFESEQDARDWIGDLLLTSRSTA